VSLARGKGRTENPRVYAGCLPCAQGRWCADLKHANIWIETLAALSLVRLDADRR
jgi:hypothetical protein